LGNFGTAKIDSPNMHPFPKAYTGRRAWKAIGTRILKPCYLSTAIIIGKLRLGNKEQMLVNFPS